MTWLQITLLSDSCFAAGAGLAAEVDIDIERENETGLPIIRGRTLKGLLVEECALLLEVFRSTQWREAANRIFGGPGRRRGGSLVIENASLPSKLRKAAYDALNPDRTPSPLSRVQLLRCLTDIRRQTKINVDGTPEDHSLRATRLAIKGLTFLSRLHGTDGLSDKEKALLAACALSVRRGGLHRNRGWGRLRLRILDQQGKDITSTWVTLLQTSSGGVSCLQ